ncbi:hypothetical protein [Kitasatospora sp. NPDC085879]|uniref:hypothetical protein n=1 Tax=Kitasatospora sp. NPDC085879 TaxID=3154769 RepID=UPI003434B15B
MSGGGATSGAPAPVFEAAWCATDLGEYRACAGTYERYPYDSLPPLDPDRYTGAFEWLGEAGDPVPDEVAALDRLAADLAAHGLALPRDFVTFHTSAGFRNTLDEVSVTCCWTDISEPLPSPVEPGAFLVRFLRDQQDCVMWYLYLRPSGEAFVVHSWLDYAYEYAAREEGEGPSTDLDDIELQRSEILWCAASFEEFAHRFWTENRLWYTVSGGDPAAVEPELRAYLRHYAATGTPA